VNGFAGHDDLRKPSSPLLMPRLDVSSRKAKACRVRFSSSMNDDHHSSPIRGSAM